MTDETSTTPALDAVKSVEADITQVLTDAAVPAPEPTPAPTPPARYVTVWPHTLGDFEKFPDAVATVLPNGTLLIHKFGAPASLPPIKGYAPGSWITFEHVGDYSPPAPPRPALASHRGAPAPAAKVETTNYAVQERASVDVVRSASPAPTAAPGTRLRQPDERPRFYDGRDKDVPPPGTTARPRTAPVPEGSDDDAPKASTGGTTPPIEHLAEPAFWEDDERAVRPSFWRRVWAGLIDGPFPDPSKTGE